MTPFVHNGVTMAQVMSTPIARPASVDIEPWLSVVCGAPSANTGEVCGVCGRWHFTPYGNARVTAHFRRYCAGTSWLGSNATKINNRSVKRKETAMNRVKLVGGVVVGSLLTLSARATDAIPDATSMTTSITAIGGTAAAAAALGFSIWLYRKLKAKAGQAVG